jgi:hypothetical protein
MAKNNLLIQINIIHMCRKHDIFKKNPSAFIILWLGASISMYEWTDTLMTFGTNVVPWEATPNSYFSVSYNS